MLCDSRKNIKKNKFQTAIPRGNQSTREPRHSATPPNDSHKYQSQTQANHILQSVQLFVGRVGLYLLFLSSIYPNQKEILTYVFMLADLFMESIIYLPTLHLYTCLSICVWYVCSSYLCLCARAQVRSSCAQSRRHETRRLRGCGGTRLGDSEDQSKHLVTVQQPRICCLQVLKSLYIRVRKILLFIHLRFTPLFRLYCIQVLCCASVGSSHLFV